MKTINFILILFCLIFLGCDYFKNQATSDKNIRKEIAQVLQSQEDAWNSGNLEGYMQGYWNSDSLKFLSNNKITCGWKSTLENYKKGYPDIDAIGKLKFTIVSIDLLCKKSALMIGKYHVTRKDNELDGCFSLTWKKINDKWVVIFDHTS